MVQYACRELMDRLDIGHLIYVEDWIAVWLNVIGFCERWSREQKALAVENGDMWADEEWSEL